MAISDCMAEHSDELKKAKEKMASLESKLKKSGIALAKVDQLKADLAVVEQAQDSSYAPANQAQDKAVTTVEAAFA